MKRAVKKKQQQVQKFWIAALAISSIGASLSALAALAPAEKTSAQIKAASFKNWGLMNDKDRSHINVLDAWKIQTGSRSVVVAVIDTGLDSQHPDLKDNVWEKIEGNRKIHGWDFVTNRPNPGDEHGHGTHVSGIIGAVTNAKAGVSGVAQKVSILPVRYYSEANSGAVNLANTVKALKYAVDQGATIINYSGGGPEFSQEEYLAMKYAEAHGVLVVAAAGNEHQDTDKMENYYYPAAYRLKNIISVAATDIHNKILPSSNWGKKHVDIAAPGESIYSTMPKNRYGTMTGTSQATAFVTGVAALIISEARAHKVKLSPAEVRELVMASADSVGDLKDKVATNGRVNAYSALRKLRERLLKPGKWDLASGDAGSLLTALLSVE